MKNLWNQVAAVHMAEVGLRNGIEFSRSKGNVEAPTVVKTRPNEREILPLLLYRIVPFHGNKSME